MEPLIALFALLAVGLAFRGGDDADARIDAPEDQYVFEGTDLSEHITARDAGGFINGVGGNDTIVGSDAEDALLGGTGNDIIIDALGQNRIEGGLGADSIPTVDNLNADGVYRHPSEYGTADPVLGGFGADQIFADDGDHVTAGTGRDTIDIYVDLFRGQDLVTIPDFNTAEDTVEVSAGEGDPDDNIVTFG